MSVLVVTLGGTIGAKPYPNPAKPPKFISPEKTGNPVVEAIEQNWGGVSYRLTELPPVDSQKINNAYLTKLVNILVNAEEDKILISVGTDGMLRVAKALQKKQISTLELRNKTILLFGAMIPLRYGQTSDGFPNLHYALDLLTGNAKPHDIKQLEQAGIGVILSAYNSYPRPFVHHARFLTQRQRHFVPCLYAGNFHALAKHREAGKGHRNRLVPAYKLAGLNR